MRADHFRIEEHRNVHCRHYGTCIDVAVREDWGGFTCAQCPLFQQDAAPRADSFAFNQPEDPGRP
ncbi:hypothetical protein P2318_03920 [Myxococcaceae bacterium GXIMD 01537]